MGWADCGDDSRGRRIGYAWAARCDHEWGGRKCYAKIDRGLAFACGGMHGTDEHSCEGYFCGAHLYATDIPGEDRSKSLCRRCSARVRAYARTGGE